MTIDLKKIFFYFIFFKVIRNVSFLNYLYGHGHELSEHLDILVPLLFKHDGAKIIFEKINEKLKCL